MDFARGTQPYRPPPNISAECKQLLQEILCIDIHCRISIPHIVQSAWFQQNLPAGFHLGPQEGDPSIMFEQQVTLQSRVSKSQRSLNSAQRSLNVGSTFPECRLNDP